jgi:predicted RNA-binding protein with PUA-like domain
VGAYWLVKTEPETFSWARQAAEGRSRWDGVRNHQAAANLRAMTVGDLAFFYHSGKTREIVGIVEVARAAYPDPTDPTGKFVAVDMKTAKPLARPVALGAIKADPALGHLMLVRHSRLSVMPIDRAAWRRILALAGETP